MKESRTVEWKADISNTFLKTVSAFANTTGGKIYFGIKDDGSVCGLQDTRSACLDIENRINETISPSPDFIFEVNNKDSVVCLIVEKGEFTPYLYKGKAYKRNDTSTVEMDRIELERLILSGRHLNFEQLKSKIQSLEFSYLQKKFSEELSIEKINTDILKTLSLYTDKSGYNNAAAIVSDQNYFPGIDIVRFGDTADIIRDRNLFENCSILEEFDNAESVFERYYSYEEINGISREKKYTIPQKAFREALANAVIHRTWDVNGKIRISMYADRLEIYSPGGLPVGISEQEYLNGQVSELRNPILSNVFFRLNIVEMFGTGITRIKEAYLKSKVAPAFEIFENSIKIILPTLTSVAYLTADEDMVLKFLRTGVLASSSQIAANMNFSKDKTIRVLNKLIEKRQVASEGAGRGTRYRSLL